VTNDTVERSKKKEVRRSVTVCDGEISRVTVGVIISDEQQ
jgi:hypothetical protein